MRRVLQTPFSRTALIQFVSQATACLPGPACLGPWVPPTCRGIQGKPVQLINRGAACRSRSRSRWRHAAPRCARLGLLLRRRLRHVLHRHIARPVTLHLLLLLAAARCRRCARLPRRRRLVSIPKHVLQVSVHCWGCCWRWRSALAACSMHRAVLAVADAYWCRGTCRREQLRRQLLPCVPWLAAAVAACSNAGTGTGGRSAAAAAGSPVAAGVLLLCLLPCPLLCQLLSEDGALKSLAWHGVH